jgi:3-dehydrosphinganine reductase
MASARVVLAGVLALPVLLIQVVNAILVLVLSIPSILLLKYSNDSKITHKDDVPKHAIITGGSSGIGLAVAQECVDQGFDKVTILARDTTKLKQAKAQLERDNTTTTICTVSVDVSDANAMKHMAPTLFTETPTTSWTFVCCCAGTAQASTFANVSSETVSHLNNVNYLGTVYTVQALVPHMTAGHVTLTSSAAGQLGVFGYTAYSPTKFALRGLAEALHMEWIDSDLSIQLVFPPDTDTPGYHEESKGKPLETQLLSETAGLMSSTTVGKQMVREALRPHPKFSVYFGLEGWMLTTLTAGMSPVSDLVDATCQIALMGLLRLVSLFYLRDFWDKIAKCAQSNEQKTDRAQYGSMENKKC